MSRNALSESGIGKEHRIPLIRIRCMTDKKWRQLRKIWQGLGESPCGENPIRKISLKNLAPGKDLYGFFEGLMQPLTYYEQIIKMPNKADKFDLRLRLIKSAAANHR